MKSIRCRLSYATWCEHFKSGECISPVKCKYQTEHMSVNVPEAIFVPTKEAWEKMQAENSRLTSENDRLTAENAKIDEYKCVIDDISEQCRELETEVAELRARLDKERLPVKVGDTIFVLLADTVIEPRKVKSITIYENTYFIDVSNDGENNARGYLSSQFRTLWFFTRAEAEARLKELQGGENADKA